MVTIASKKVKYAYQEWPPPADTASRNNQNVEMRRDNGFIGI
jgi:hypothetical protein